MARFATIDIGTNSVLLLVAERGPEGHFTPVVERADITRLGRGVDASRRLSEEGMEETLATVARFAEEARALGAQGLAVSATSAARDAANGADFLARARSRAGVEVDIISGAEEARLSFAAVMDAFPEAAKGPLVVIDIGGGSTELIYGGTGARAGQVEFRHSFDVGSVRLTERFVRADPPDEAAERAMAALLASELARAPSPPARPTVVGVAGTVTTLYALEHRIDPYDADRVEGGVLALTELKALRARLWSLPVAERRRLPGLQPKRADVIPAGALILEKALERLGAEACTVSDRGLRWGLLADRFGARGG